MPAQYTPPPPPAKKGAGFGWIAGFVIAVSAARFASNYTKPKPPAPVIRPVPMMPKPATPKPANPSKPTAPPLGPWKGP